MYQIYKECFISGLKYLYYIIIMYSYWSLYCYVDLYKENVFWSNDEKDEEKLIISKLLIKVKKIYYYIIIIKMTYDV